MKKIFIKLARLFGYEIIDQNSFKSPTLNKDLNDDLSILNKRSIVLPLGNVKITRKVNSILIVMRMNTEIEIWDQNKKRLFEQPKIEYSLRSINSLIRSIKFCQSKFSALKIKTIIIDDHSKEKNLNKIKELVKNENIKIIPLNYNQYETSIKKQKSTETFSNLASLLKSFETGRKEGEDLIYFVEDDYLHDESMLEEMIESYERISSQIGRDIFMCPSDYPYLYMNSEKTNILIGSKRHWRSIDRTLCTFLTSKNLLDKYWDNFHKTCLDRHYPFEKYINQIYQKELCISPIKSLSLHLTNINSSYGLAPFLDYKRLWDENK
tara:strand:- start:342 stop:1310 length:969 start_codon:yes stop_codon:yes gene_type:complete